MNRRWFKFGYALGMVLWLCIATLLGWVLIAAAEWIGRH